ncbi:AlbA family DNA-binding domain-containing protein [Streptomyces sp. NPDC003753]
MAKERTDGEQGATSADPTAEPHALHARTGRPSLRSVAGARADDDLEMVSHQTTVDTLTGTERSVGRSVRDLDVGELRASLRAQRPTLLRGLREGQRLDAKKQPCDPRNPAAVEELAKDVAAFANRGGGLIVLGMATRLEGDEEVLESFTGLERSAVNLDQLRKLIRQHVLPTPQGITVDWSDDGEQRVVFIDIPEQDRAEVFVIPAPSGRPGKVPGHTVAVPLRDADGTDWMPRAEIQRLLTAGRAVTDTEVDERAIMRKFKKWNRPGELRHRLALCCGREELYFAANRKWDSEDLRLFLLGGAIQQRFLVRHWLEACRADPKLPRFLGRVMSTTVNGRRPPLRAAWCAAQLAEGQRYAALAAMTDGDRQLQVGLIAAIRGNDVGKAESEIVGALKAEQFSDGEIAIEMHELTGHGTGGFSLL